MAPTVPSLTRRLYEFFYSRTAGLTVVACLLSAPAGATPAVLTIKLNPNVPWGVFTAFEKAIADRSGQEYALSVREHAGKAIVEIQGTRDRKLLFQKSLETGAKFTESLRSADPRVEEATRAMGLQVSLAGSRPHATQMELQFSSQPTSLIDPNPVRILLKRQGKHWTATRDRLTVEFRRASISVR